jgi:hypothetical protein
LWNAPATIRIAVACPLATGGAPLPLP